MPEAALRRAAEEPLAELEEQLAAASEDVHRVLEILRERAFDSDLGEASLREIVGERVLAGFTDETGISPGTCLARLRMATAASLLVETDLAVNLVGRLVGYEEPHHFRTYFQRLVGESVGDFRRRVATVPREGSVADASGIVPAEGRRVQGRICAALWRFLEGLPPELGRQAFGNGGLRSGSVELFDALLERCLEAGDLESASMLSQICLETVEASAGMLGPRYRGVRARVEGELAKVRAQLDSPSGRDGPAAASESKASSPPVSSR